MPQHGPPGNRHGGKRAPDGRPPQAPGVGKTARRHDLERTPGASSDIPSGEVGQTQEGIKTAPIAPGKNSAGTTGPVQTENRGKLEIPDAIDFAGKRAGQGIGLTGSGEQEPLDMDQWLPLLRALGAKPKRSGPLAAALLQQLANANNTPGAGRVRVIDENQIQAAIETSYA